MGMRTVLAAAVAILVLCGDVMAGGLTCPLDNDPLATTSLRSRETPPPGTYLLYQGKKLTSRYFCLRSTTGNNYTWSVTNNGGVFTNLNGQILTGPTVGMALYWPVKVGTFTIECRLGSQIVGTADDVRQYLLDLVQDDLPVEGRDVWMNIGRQEPNCENKDNATPSTPKGAVEAQFDYPTPGGDPGSLFASRREPCLYRILLSGPKGELDIKLDYTFHGNGRIDTGTPATTTAVRTIALNIDPGGSSTIDGKSVDVDEGPWLINLPHLTGIVDSSYRRDIEIDVRIPPTQPQQTLGARIQGVSEFEMCTVVSVYDVTLQDVKRPVPPKGPQDLAFGVAFLVSPYDVQEFEITKSLVFYRIVGPDHPNEDWRGKVRTIDRHLKVDSGTHTMHWPGDNEIQEDRAGNDEVHVAGFSGSANLFFDEDIVGDGWAADDDQAYPRYYIKPWLYPSGNGQNDAEPWESLLTPLPGGCPTLRKGLLLFSPDVDLFRGDATTEFTEDAEDAADPFVPRYLPYYSQTPPKLVRAELRVNRSKLEAMFAPPGGEDPLNVKLTLQSSGHTSTHADAAGTTLLPPLTEYSEQELPRDVWLKGLTLGEERGPWVEFKGEETDAGGDSVVDRAGFTVFTGEIVSPVDAMDPKLRNARNLQVTGKPLPSGDHEYVVRLEIRSGGSLVRTLAESEQASGGGGNHERLGRQGLRGRDRRSIEHPPDRSHDHRTRERQQSPLHLRNAGRVCRQARSGEGRDQLTRSRGSLPTRLSRRDPSCRRRPSG